MPRSPLKPPQLRGRHFRGSDVVNRGWLTRAQLKGPSWRRLFHNVYADADLDDSHRLRCEAIGLILPKTAAVTGRSAVCLDAFSMGRPEDPVHVLAPLRTRFAHQGVRLVRTAWLPAEHVVPGSPNVTTPERTAWEIAGEPDVEEAVVVLDRLFRARRPHQETMNRWMAAFPASPAATTIGLADGRAESPQESRARVRLTLAGFPPPVPQYEIIVHGRFVARVDLAWPEAKVAVEYDGVWHAEAEQLSLDRVRLNNLLDAGWTVRALTGADLRDPKRFAAFCVHLRNALSA
jgi:hypothetical protein